MTDNNVSEHTKELVLQRIKETDKTLGEIKEFFNSHAGEEITDADGIREITQLENVAKQLMVDLNVMKQFMLKVYGIFVFTENGV